MKGRCMQTKGTSKEMNATWKEHERTWMQNKSNMNCRGSTWNQQNNSSIDFRAFLGMDFGFMLDLEYAHFYKTLESDRAPPISDNHNSVVKDFDGISSHRYRYIMNHIHQKKSLANSYTNWIYLFWFHNGPIYGLQATSCRYVNQKKSQLIVGGRSSGNQTWQPLAALETTGGFFVGKSMV